MNKFIFTIISFISFFVHSQENMILNYSVTDNNAQFKSALYVINNESIYRINAISEKKIDNINQIQMPVNDTISKVFYYDNKKSINRIFTSKNEIVYETFPEQINYNITNNVKKIGEYNCQEALLSLNGRKYEIWFSNDIPISFGPLKINGLPGLVVELIEETNNLRITLNSIFKIKNSKEFDIYKKYLLDRKVLSYADYETKITQLTINKKLKILSKIAEFQQSGGTINIGDSGESESIYTHNLIDIPSNLIEELKKIK